MSVQHPITPPLELVRQWSLEAEEKHQPTVRYSIVSLLAAKAAQWGADQELKACCELMDDWGLEESDLRAARRPEPLSLKEQALAKLPEHPENMDSYLTLTPGSVATIRRALEALDD
jgi:hypothetical protein